MELNIHIQIGTCTEFKDDHGREKSVSSVITPLKVRLNENGDKAQIVTGCNWYNSCHNENCFYSKFSKARRGVNK